MSKYYSYYRPLNVTKVVCCNRKRSGVICRVPLKPAEMCPLRAKGDAGWCGGGGHPPPFPGLFRYFPWSNSSAGYRLYAGLETAAQESSTTADRFVKSLLMTVSCESMESCLAVLCGKK
ncbi:hypothetical protein CDAR_103761 [Caerostris darwini]|uniref:Uncharacterized protein n=1 Tax=Caerostris darwini TaxID=1538125 RepID=A0AAV4URN0_9ARAC|nr:hypothetical protein CDAR_103761 [Caerostris darwini]